MDHMRNQHPLRRIEFRVIRQCRLWQDRFKSPRHPLLPLATPHQMRKQQRGFRLRPRQVSWRGLSGRVSFVVLAVCSKCSVSHDRKLNPRGTVFSQNLAAGL